MFEACNSLWPVSYTEPAKPVVTSAIVCPFLADLSNKNINPFDFLPDLVPFLGQADDLFLLALVLNNLLSSVDQTVLEEHWSGRGRILALTQKSLSAAAALIPGDMAGKLRRLGRLK